MKALDFHVDIAIANFARKHLCTVALTPAGPVFQTNMPAMPAADDFADLHDAFAQRKPKVWTEIFEGINAVVPAEQRDIEPGDFNRMTETF